MSGRTLKCWRMLTETLSGSRVSWDATFRERKRPYLKESTYRLFTMILPKTQKKEGIDYLSANCWCVIRVGYPDLDILTISITPQHLICCKTKSFSYNPGRCWTFGLKHRMKCGVVLSNCCINLNRWSYKHIRKYPCHMNCPTPMTRYDRITWPYPKIMNQANWVLSTGTTEAQLRYFRSY